MENIFLVHPLEQCRIKSRHTLRHLSSGLPFLVAVKWRQFRGVDSWLLRLTSIRLVNHSSPGVQQISSTMFALLLQQLTAVTSARTARPGSSMLRAEFWQRIVSFQPARHPVDPDSSSFRGRPHVEACRVEVVEIPFRPIQRRSQLISHTGEPRYMDYAPGQPPCKPTNHSACDFRHT